MALEPFALIHSRPIDPLEMFASGILEAEPETVGLTGNVGDLAQDGRAGGLSVRYGAGLG